MLAPLAERLRPKTLDEYIGQEHLVGKGAVLRRMIDSGEVSSFILWGPPGVGKNDFGPYHLGSTQNAVLYIECHTLGSKRGT